MPIKIERADELDVRHWIAKRVQQYAESPRTGIPRGNELPMPKHKHHAALLMLLYGNALGQDLSDFAEEAGCTYNLLGKWRTEQRFWAMVERAADEYLNQFFKTYLLLAQESVQHEDEAGRLIGDLIIRLEATWGEILFERAFEKINKTFRQENLVTRAKYQVYYLAIVCAKHWKDESLKAQIVEKCKELYRSSVENFKSLAKHLLEKGDKAGVIAVLDVLGRWAIEGDSDFMDVAFGIRRKRSGA